MLADPRGRSHYEVKLTASMGTQTGIAQTDSNIYSIRQYLKDI